MNLMLIRHAESTGNSEGRWIGREDVPLSELGRRQAQYLKARLENAAFLPTHIYSSPLSRTLETARIVASDWACPIEAWHDLIEIDVGAFSGMTGLEIQQKFPSVAREFYATHNFDLVKGAERHDERNARARRVVDRLARRHANGDSVMLFSHGGIMLHLISAILGADRVWSLNIENTALFDFTMDIGSPNNDPSIRNEISRWSINRFNDTRHLHP